RLAAAAVCQPVETWRWDGRLRDPEIVLTSDLEDEVRMLDHQGNVLGLVDFQAALALGDVDGDAASILGACTTSAPGGGGDPTTPRASRARPPPGLSPGSPPAHPGTPSRRSPPLSSPRAPIPRPTCAPSPSSESPRWAPRRPAPTREWSPPSPPASTTRRRTC